MNPAASQAIGWLVTTVHVALAVALLVVALVRTRKASAAGGYLLAASAGVEALGSCCARGLTTYWHHVVDTDGYEAAERLATAQGLLSLLVDLVAGGMLVAGLVLAARALTTRRTA